MKKRKDFNGLILFKTPIIIEDAPPNGLRSIWGFFYDKEEAHANDLWSWTVNCFIAYLIGCNRCQQSGGQVFKDKWITKDGNPIPMTPHTRNFTYKVLKDIEGIPEYRVIEAEEKFFIPPMERNGSFLTCHAFVDRYELENEYKIRYNI